jgi:endonuclease-3
MKEPKNWKIQHELISKFRKINPAPVDTMGCHIQENPDKKTKRYHILTSLQLSSQTKDPVNYEAMQKLKNLPGGLTPESIDEIDPKELNECIRMVGFHNRKTEYMKKTARILIERYRSDIPDTLDGLLKLPGIGPKMAYLCLQEAWDCVIGIGVDTHVHRISRRLGWTSVKAKTPEQTRKELEDWLPLEHWGTVNGLLVGFGQSICKPVGPLCQECPALNVCPRNGVKSQK